MGGADIGGDGLWLSRRALRDAGRKHSPIRRHSVPQCLTILCTNPHLNKIRIVKVFKAYWTQSTCWRPKSQACGTLHRRATWRCRRGLESRTMVEVAANGALRVVAPALASLSSEAGGADAEGMPVPPMWADPISFPARNAV